MGKRDEYFRRFWGFLVVVVVAAVVGGWMKFKSDPNRKESLFLLAGTFFWTLALVSSTDDAGLGVVEVVDGVVHSHPSATGAKG